MSAAIKKLDYFHVLFYIVIIHIYKNFFRNSKINTLYIKNTNVMVVSPFFMKFRILKDVGVKFVAKVEVILRAISGLFCTEMSNFES